MYVCMYVCLCGWVDGWMDGWMVGWMDGTPVWKVPRTTMWNKVSQYHAKNDPKTWLKQSNLQIYSKKYILGGYWKGGTIYIYTYLFVYIFIYLFSPLLLNQVGAYSIK